MTRISLLSSSSLLTPFGTSFGEKGTTANDRLAAVTVYNRHRSTVRIYIGAEHADERSRRQNNAATIAAMSSAVLLIDRRRHVRDRELILTCGDPEAHEQSTEPSEHSVRTASCFLSMQGSCLSAFGRQSKPESPDTLSLQGTRWRRVPVAYRDGDTTKAKSQASATYALQSLTKGRTGEAGTVLLLLPTRCETTFMGDLPDSSPISTLCLPGTHETFARYGWPISQCQEPGSTVATQLKAGIRFMDFRVTPKGEKGRERLLAYHGATDEKIELGDALEQVYHFLQGEGKTETVIISLKPEGGDARLMQSLLFDLYVTDSKRRLWFLEARIPTVGEVRGKAVMFSRFGRADEQPGGIHPPVWPNNLRGLFNYDLPVTGQKVTTQDWFSIGTVWQVKNKFKLVTELLENEAAREPNTLALNFCSASTFPLALPPVVSKGLLSRGPRWLGVTGINVRLRDYIATVLARSLAPNDQGHVAGQLQAILALDYFDFADAQDLVPLLIEANFGRPAGAPSSS